MIPWRRKWLPTPVFLLGEFHGQRSLVGYSPWRHKEMDTTEQLTLSDKGPVSRTHKELSKVNSKKRKYLIRTHIKRHFTKEDIQRAGKYVKICSTSLIVSEMQIKPH